LLYYLHCFIANYLIVFKYSGRSIASFSNPFLTAPMQSSKALNLAEIAIIFSEISSFVVTIESIFSTVRVEAPNPSIWDFYSSKLDYFYFKMSILLSYELNWSFIWSLLSAIWFASFCIFVLRSIRDLRATSDLATTSYDTLSTLVINSLLFLSILAPGYLSWYCWYCYYPYAAAPVTAPVAKPAIFPAALFGCKPNYFVCWAAAA